MPHQYAYSPTTPSYSPKNFAPASRGYSPRKANKGMIGKFLAYDMKFHMAWVVGAICIGLAIWYTRILYDGQYAQQAAMSNPKLVNFIYTTQGKIFTAFLYVVAGGLFTGAYKQYVGKY
jgi:hypothetical protein